MMYIYVGTKKIQSEGTYTATEIFKELIQGDRFNEILREPVPKLMSEPFRMVEGYENPVKYMVTV